MILLSPERILLRKLPAFCGNDGAVGCIFITFSVALPETVELKCDTTSKFRVTGGCIFIPDRPGDWAGDGATVFGWTIVRCMTRGFVCIVGVWAADLSRREGRLFITTTGLVKRTLDLLPIVLRLLAKTS